jgi:hypothetical protein
MHNRRKVDDKDLNRPTLRKAPGGSTAPIEDDKSKGKDKDQQKEDPDERPTLKRRG